MTTLPKRSKIDSISNSIEVFTDQFLYISVQQGNEAWARDAGMEKEARENFDNATYALLRLAFSFSKRVSDKLNKDKICTHIAMSDCVIHEILLGFLFRGVYLISESFANHSGKDDLIGLYSENLFIERILAPFYQFKISNDNSIPALKKSSLQSDIGQVVSGALESRRPLRRMCDDLDNLPGYINFAIRTHLSTNQGNSDSKSIVMLGENMVGDKNDDQRLSPYCELVSACINNEINAYMAESDEKLATVIHNFFM